MCCVAARVSSRYDTDGDGPLTESSFPKDSPFVVVLGVADSPRRTKANPDMPTASGRQLHGEQVAADLIHEAAAAHEPTGGTSQAGDGFSRDGSRLRVRVRHLAQAEYRRQPPLPARPSHEVPCSCPEPTPEFGPSSARTPCCSSLADPSRRAAGSDSTFLPAPGLRPPCSPLPRPPPVDRTAATNNVLSPNGYAFRRPSASRPLS